MIGKLETFSNATKERPYRRQVNRIKGSWATAQQAICNNKGTQHQMTDGRRVEAEHVSSKDKESKRSDEAAAYVFARVPRAAQVFFIDIPTLPGFISRGVVLDIPFPVVAYFLFGRPIVVPASLSY